MIQVENLTLQYPNGEGIRAVSFQVKEGQIVGYLPGEIAFFDGMTGRQFLRFLAQMRGIKDLSRQKELEVLPEGLMSAFGFDSVSTNLTGFLADYYYGFIVFIVPLIYCIITANKLVAKQVDNGSFAYLLMAPVSRRTIIVTKGACLLSSIAVLFVLGGTSPQAKFLKDFSVYSLLDTQRILEGSGTAGLEGMMIALILLLFALSAFVFDRKTCLSENGGAYIKKIPLRKAILVPILAIAGALADLDLIFPGEPGGGGPRQGHLYRLAGGLSPG